MWGVNVADLPLILLTIAWLVLLEGLLSADNALVLAVMVRHLPKQKRTLALRYGIWARLSFARSPSSARRTSFIIGNSKWREGCIFSIWRDLISSSATRTATVRAWATNMPDPVFG